MELYLNKNLILESNVPFEKANFGLLGVPFDSTSTYRSGSRFAPLEIRKEFFEMEKETLGKNFFDLRYRQSSRKNDNAVLRPDDTVAGGYDDVIFTDDTDHYGPFGEGNLFEGFVHDIRCFKRQGLHDLRLLSFNGNV